MLLRFCPTNKLALRQTIGYKKRILQTFGQVVNAERLRNRKQYFEISCPLTQSYLGVIHENDTMAVETTREEAEKRYNALMRQ